jgi:hypothetical protein
MRQLVSSRLVSRLLPLVPAALLLGCSDPTPIDPTALADQASLHAREVVHQAGGGVAFVEQDDSGLAKIATGMGHASDGLQGVAAMIPPPMMSAMSDSPMMMAAAGLPSMQTTEEQWDDTADDLRVWLRQRVLADENLESHTDSEAVYLLHAEPTCRALPRADDPPGTMPTLDTGCADDLNKMEVRVALRADGDGVRLTIQLGPDRLELAAVVIHSDLLAVEADLPKTIKATQFMAYALGQDDPLNGTKFEALEGKLRLSLQKDGEKKATVALGVLSAVHVAVTSSSGALGPDVRVAASNPLLAFSADGVAQSATVKLDVGAVDVLGDWDPQGGAPDNRDLHVAVGGLTGALTFTEGDDKVVGKGLGIGDTSVKVHNATLFDLGLNPTDMHRFDVDVALDQAGEPRFELKPRFDMSLGVHFNVVTDDYARDNQPASWLLDETYRIALENGGAAAAIASAPATATFDGGLKVGPGTLTLSSTKLADPIVVPAGKCLTHNPNPPAGAHPLLGALMTADCP